jgi:glycosyltransferase involved in cell wall biosynthesis
MFQVGSWHYAKGGTDQFVKTISHWLAKKGNKIVVLVHRLENEKCSDEDIKFGKGIIKIRYTPSQRKGLRFNPLVYGYRLAITSYYLYKQAKKENIDAIVVGETELLATLPLKLLKTKIFCRGGALMYETMSKEVIKERGKNLYSSFFTFLIKIYNNLTLKLPEVMVPVNSSEYDFMNKHKRKNAKIITIPHGVDVDLFKPLKSVHKKIAVGYVGRLAPIKYPEIALEIFKEASKGQNSEFWWIGPLDPSFNKNYFENLKSKINVKNAKYLGQIKNEKLPNLLNKLDIFLQVEQQKNVSRSTTEAAACGLPIVALNIGKEPYGLFTMDKNKAVNELRKLILSKDYRKKASRKARQVIEKDYSEDKIYSKYLTLFKNLTK